MRKKNEKNNKGITLIALIITIIVMLILVSVTITMAVNGGLFDYARKASSETNKSIDAEQQLANGKVQIGGIWYDSIDEYLEGYGKIKISYDYDKTEGIETTVNLKFDIIGVPTFEEYAEEYFKKISPEYLEDLYAIAISEANEKDFDNYITNNYGSKDEFVEEIKTETGLEYEEGLKAKIKENELFAMFYYAVINGGVDNTSLENLVVKSIGFPGSFDDLLNAENTDRTGLAQMLKQDFGLDYEDALKVLIAEGGVEEPKLTVTLPNGETRELSYFEDLATSFTVTENGKYTIKVTGVNGHKGEETIEIGNIKAYTGLTITHETEDVVYTDKDGNVKELTEQVEDGDIVQYGDYEYRYNSKCDYIYDEPDVYMGWIFDSTQGGWGARVKDDTKSSYTELCGTILNKKVNVLSYTFSGCKLLIEMPQIPESVNMLNYTFKNCNSLVNVVIPKNIIDLGEQSFHNCENLTNVVIEGNVKKIGEMCFYGCPELSSIEIPESIEIIGDSSFAGCGLSRLYINCDSLAIGSAAFGGCVNLESLSIKGTSVIVGKNAFKWCEKLNSVELEGVSSIGELAFSFCKSLEHVYIPSSVMVIGELAFSESGSVIYCEHGSQPDGWDDGWNLALTVNSSGRCTTKFGYTLQQYKNETENL